MIGSNNVPKPDAIAGSFANAPEELRARGFLPPDYFAVVLTGSILRGWGNSGSDVDVYVVIDEPWYSPTSIEQAVLLEPARVTCEDIMVDGLRWDIRYWLQAQIDQVFAKVSREAFDSGRTSAASMALSEITLLDRLRFAVAPGREDWLAVARERLSVSAFRPMIASHRLNLADSFIEDAIGQLDSGDTASAVLSARTAFGLAVDALLASLGECGPNVKWRARSLASVRTEVISFPDYWAVETMRTLAPDDPAPWVLDVIARIQRICAGVEL